MAVVVFGTGDEDLRVEARLFEVVDGQAGAVVAGVAFRGGDDAAGVRVFPAEDVGVEAAIQRGLHGVKQFAVK